MIYVDDNGRPVSPPPPSDRQSFKDSLKDVRPENIDTRHLYAVSIDWALEICLAFSLTCKFCTCCMLFYKYISYMALDDANLVKINHSSYLKTITRLAGVP